MLVRMSASALTRFVLVALWGAFAVALRWVWSNVVGGFVDDWITGLLGPAIGLEEKQVIDTLTSWVVPGFLAYLAMWAAYSYGAHHPKLAKAAAHEPAPIPALSPVTATPVDVRAITNPELATQLHVFTKRLRTFELIENGATDVEEARIDIMNAKIGTLGRMLKADAASKNAIQSEIAGLETRASDLEMARSRRRLSEFQTQFLQEASQLRAELSRRTGRPVGGPDDPATDLLDKGKFEMKFLRALTSLKNS